MKKKQTNRKILVIVAHADDEALGCGGTILKHIDNGDSVHVMFMTNGISARINNENNAEEVRNTAMKKAMHTLGVHHYHTFDFPDNKMDTVPLLDVVQKIEPIISNFQPDTIYTHFLHDLNIDHQITHQAVMTACRPIKGSSIQRIFSFEVLSSTEWNSVSHSQFKAQYIVDITPFWQQKMQALSCYNKELRAFPHSRSIECIEALAILRGATNGLEKAEAFQVERIVES